MNTKTILFAVITAILVTGIVAAQPFAFADDDDDKKKAKKGKFLVAETINLQGELQSGDFKLLMDVTPFEAVNGHVAMKVPCDEDGNTTLVILAGTAKTDDEGDTSLGALNTEIVSDVSNPGTVCVYHADLVLSNVSAEIAGDNVGDPVPVITDVAIINVGGSAVDFGNNPGYTVTVNAAVR